MVARTASSNPGWLKKLAERYRRQSHRLAIGWPRGSGAIGQAYPDGTQVALVAAVQQYGSDSNGIPARPFLTEGVKDATRVTSPIIERLAPKIAQGKIRPEQILEHCGQPAVGAVQERLTDGPWTPNAPATVEAKGSSRPLIDEGQMRQSITYVVREG